MSYGTDIRRGMPAPWIYGAGVCGWYVCVVPAELRGSRRREQSAIHNYIGHNCIGHNHTGHYYLDRNYIDHEEVNSLPYRSTPHGILRLHKAPKQNIIQWVRGEYTWP